MKTSIVLSSLVAVTLSLTGPPSSPPSKFNGLPGDACFKACRSTCYFFLPKGERNTDPVSCTACVAPSQFVHCVFKISGAEVKRNAFCPTDLPVVPTVEEE